MTHPTKSLTIRKENTKKEDPISMNAFPFNVPLQAAGRMIGREPRVLPSIGGCIVVPLPRQIKQKAMGLL